MLSHERHRLVVVIIQFHRDCEIICDCECLFVYSTVHCLCLGIDLAFEIERFSLPPDFAETVHESALSAEDILEVVRPITSQQS
mmetsp:Transcript_28612/g.88513  ORF Transcript_28612/g.88513 Transcript_28612/m.88513 type:complete len:84 (-) Transcript_28612:139-390(-)